MTDFNLFDKIKNDEQYRKVIRISIPIENIKQVIRDNPRKGMFSSQLFGFEENYFLIGDFPIIFKNSPKTIDEIVHGEFLMPISSKRVYCARENSELNFSVQNAYDMNAIIIEQSEKYICSPNKEYLIKCIQYWKELKRRRLLSYLNSTLFN